MNKTNTKKYFKRIQKNSTNLKMLNFGCNSCGSCCKCIHINESYEKLKNYKKEDKSPDLKFILDNWSEITYEEAVKINPYLKNDFSKMHYYTCKQYDTESNKCKVHFTNKPPVCKDYPVYNHLNRKPLAWLDRKPDYSKKCGYWNKKGDGRK